MLDYTFFITEYDADNVDESFKVNHGRTEHFLNLTTKSYVKTIKGDNVEDTFIQLVWNDNIEVISAFIQRELNEVNAQVLLEKARVYELYNFGAMMRVGPNDITDARATLAETQATQTFLKNYIVRESFPAQLQIYNITTDSINTIITVNMTFDFSISINYGKAWVYYTNIPDADPATNPDLYTNLGAWEFNPIASNTPYDMTVFHPGIEGAYYVVGTYDSGSGFFIYSPQFQLPYRGGCC